MAKYRVCYNDYTGQYALQRRGWFGFWSLIYTGFEIVTFSTWHTAVDWIRERNIADTTQPMDFKPIRSARQKNIDIPSQMN